MSAEKFVGERIFGFRTFLSPTGAGVRNFFGPPRDWYVIRVRRAKRRHLEL